MEKRGNYRVEGGNTKIKCLPWERFSIFLLIDFAARLFGQKQNDIEGYIYLKSEAAREYISDDAIDDRIPKKCSLIRPWTELKIKEIKGCLKNLVGQGTK